MYPLKINHNVLRRIHVHVTILKRKHILKQAKLLRNNAEIGKDLCWLFLICIRFVLVRVQMVNGNVNQKHVPMKFNVQAIKSIQQMLHHVRKHVIICIRT